MLTKLSHEQDIKGIPAPCALNGRVMFNAVIELLFNQKKCLITFLMKQNIYDLGAVR